MNAEVYKYLVHKNGLCNKDPQRCNCYENFSFDCFNVSKRVTRSMTRKDISLPRSYDDTDMEFKKNQSKPKVKRRHSVANPLRKNLEQLNEEIEICCAQRKSRSPHSRQKKNNIKDIGKKPEIEKQMEMIFTGRKFETGYKAIDTTLDLLKILDSETEDIPANNEIASKPKKKKCSEEKKPKKNQSNMEHFKKRLIHNLQAKTDNHTQCGQTAVKTKETSCTAAKAKCGPKNKLQLENLELFKLGNGIPTSLCKSKESYLVSTEKNLQYRCETQQNIILTPGRHSLPAVIPENLVMPKKRINSISTDNSELSQKSLRRRRSSVAGLEIIGAKTAPTEKRRNSSFHYQPPMNPLDMSMKEKASTVNTVNRDPRLRPGNQCYQIVYKTMPTAPENHNVVPLQYPHIVINNNNNLANRNFPIQGQVPGSNNASKIHTVPSPVRRTIHNQLNNLAIEDNSIEATEANGSFLDYLAERDFAVFGSKLYQVFAEQTKLGKKIDFENILQAAKGNPVQVALRHSDNFKTEEIIVLDDEEEMHVEKIPPDPNKNALKPPLKVISTTPKRKESVKQTRAQKIRKPTKNNTIFIEDDESLRKRITNNHIAQTIPPSVVPNPTTPKRHLSLIESHRNNQQKQLAVYDQNQTNFPNTCLNLSSVPSYPPPVNTSMNFTIERLLLRSPNDLNSSLKAPNTECDQYRRSHSLESGSSAASSCTLEMDELISDSCELIVNGKMFRLTAALYRKFPKGKLHYDRASNTIVRYFDDNERDLYMRNVNNRYGSPLGRYRAKIDDSTVFSHKDFLSDPEEYCVEMEKVEKTIPKDFFLFYKFVTGYQVMKNNHPISFTTFLIMHNTNRLGGLLENYVRYLMEERTTHYDSERFGVRED